MKALSMKNPSTLIPLCLAILFFAAGCSNDETKASATITTLESVGLKEGVAYSKTKVQDNASQNQIREFFWYGCTHCEKFEAVATVWKQDLDADITFLQTPAIWSSVMEFHAKIFYIAQQMDNFPRVHIGLFEVIMAMSEKDIDEQTQVLRDYFVKQGMSDDRFGRLLNGEEIQQKTDAAKQLWKNSGATGTPSITINDRYVVLNKNIKSYADIVNIGDTILKIDATK